MEVRKMLSVEQTIAMYEELLKDKEEKVPVPTPQELREPVKEGQIREILFLTKERCLVAKEVEPDLFVVVPLTPHIKLCPKEGLAVAVKRKRDGKEFVWGVVPSYAYIRREVLENYSVVVFDYLEKEDRGKILEFADTYDRSKLPSYKKKFLKLIMSRYADLMWASFVKHIS